MSPDVPLHNEIEPQYEENAAGGIQRGVQMRKNAQDIHVERSLPKPEQYEQHDPQEAHKMPIPTDGPGEPSPIKSFVISRGRPPGPQQYRPKSRYTAEHV